MADFVNIESGNDTLNIIPYNPTSISNVNLDSEIIDGLVTPEEADVVDNNVFTIDRIQTNFETPAEEPILVHEDCDVSRTYGVGDSDSFKKSNLFSELVDDYQRSIARNNLGIADKYSLVWGAITGNIIQQIDLNNLIVSQIATYENALIDEINLALARWAVELNTELQLKAPLDSPTFTGTPTTTLPSIDDDSNRIASTEWVNAKLGGWSGTSNLTSFTLSKDFMYVDESNITTICNWTYDGEVESQTINGITLSPEVRQYIFTNINESFVISLSYTMNNETFVKNITFERIIPKFYGKVLDYTQAIKSRYDFATVTCNEDEYAYVYIPNGVNARISVDNLVGGFTFLGTILISNVTYYIYKTYHSGLGKLYITIL